MIVSNGLAVAPARWFSSRAFLALIGALLLAGLAAAPACSPGAYTCTSNAQCLSSSGQQGICEEVTGYCSYPDSLCAQNGGTGERYAESAGSLASQCVAKGTSACVGQIAVGLDFACYIRTTDGSVWCWGHNADGELGDGTYTSRSHPVQVAGLPGAASAISVGEYHSCAIMQTDGSVWCWGINDQSNLGQCLDGTQLVNSNHPLQVFNATVKLAAAGVDAGAAGEGGAPAATWACDPSKPLHAMQPGASNVTGPLTVGGEHTCVIDSGGETLCWGENTVLAVGGQSGQDFSTFPIVLGPLVVTGSDSQTFMTDQIINLQAGDSSTCLLTAASNVYCFGGNGNGELGNGGATPWSASPTLVAFPSGNGADNLLVDEDTACAISAGTVSCWGNGGTGLFAPGGVSSSSNQTTPVSLGTASQLFGGPTGQTMCIQDPSNAIKCWGSNNNGQAATGSLTAINVLSWTPALIASVSQIVIGGDHGCAVTVDGELYCWGDNADGELGNGSVAANAPNPIPTQVSVTCK